MPDIGRRADFRARRPPWADRRRLRAAGGTGTGPWTGVRGDRLRAAACALGAAALAIAAAGCASAPFHRHFEARRYHEAMGAFQADSASLRQDEQALYRVGLLYASPDSPYYDPARATEAIERLLRLHPDTERRHEARHLLALLEEVRSLGGQVSRLRMQLKQLKAVDLEEPPPDSTGRQR